jgi:hypothetical protein
MDARELMAGHRLLTNFSQRFFLPLPVPPRVIEAYNPAHGWLPPLPSLRL